jgi:hypothetical protein
VWQSSKAIHHGSDIEATSERARDKNRRKPTREKWLWCAFEKHESESVALKQTQEEAKFSARSDTRDGWRKKKSDARSRKMFIIVSGSLASKKSLFKRIGGSNAKSERHLIIAFSLRGDIQTAFVLSLDTVRRWCFARKYYFVISRASFLLLHDKDESLTIYDGFSCDLFNFAPLKLNERRKLRNAILIPLASWHSLDLARHAIMS